MAERPPPAVPLGAPLAEAPPAAHALPVAPANVPMVALVASAPMDPRRRAYAASSIPASTPAPVPMPAPAQAPAQAPPGAAPAAAGPAPPPATTPLAAAAFTPPAPSSACPSVPTAPAVASPSAPANHCLTARLGLPSALLPMATPAAPLVGFATPPLPPASPLPSGGGAFTDLAARIGRAGSSAVAPSVPDVPASVERAPPSALPAAPRPVLPTPPQPALPTTPKPASTGTTVTADAPEQALRKPSPSPPQPRFVLPSRLAPSSGARGRPADTKAGSMANRAEIFIVERARALAADGANARPPPTAAAAPPPKPSTEPAAGGVAGGQPLRAPYKYKDILPLEPQVMPSAPLPATPPTVTATAAAAATKPPALTPMTSVEAHTPPSVGDWIIKRQERREMEAKQASPLRRRFTWKRRTDAETSPLAGAAKPATLPQPSNGVPVAVVMVGTASDCTASTGAAGGDRLAAQSNSVKVHDVHAKTDVIPPLPPPLPHPAQETGLPPAPVSAALLPFQMRSPPARPIASGIDKAHWPGQHGPKPGGSASAPAPPPPSAGFDSRLLQAARAQREARAKEQGGGPPNATPAPKPPSLPSLPTLPPPAAQAATPAPLPAAPPKPAAHASELAPPPSVAAPAASPTRPSALLAKLAADARHAAAAAVATELPEARPRKPAAADRAVLPQPASTSEAELAQQPKDAAAANEEADQELLDGGIVPAGPACDRSPAKSVATRAKAAPAPASVPSLPTGSVLPPNLPSLLLAEIRRGVDILHHLVLQRRQVNRSRIALRKARYFEMLPSESHLRTLAVRSEPPPTGAEEKNTTAPTASANEGTSAPSVEASEMTTTEPAAMELDTTAPAPAFAREPAPAPLWQHSQDSPIDYADVIEFFAKPSVRQTKPGMYFDEELERHPSLPQITADTIIDRLREQSYTKYAELHADMRTMLDQCYFLLAPTSNDYKKGRRLERQYREFCEQAGVELPWTPDDGSLDKRLRGPTSVLNMELTPEQKATLAKASENVPEGLDEASMRFVLFSIVEDAQVSYLFEYPTSHHFPEYVNLPHPITLRSVALNLSASATVYTTLQELVRDIVLTLSNFSYYAAVATPTMQEVLRVRPVLFRALESLAARPLATPLTSDDRLQHFLDKESGDMLEVATFLQRHHLQLFGSNVRTSRPPPIAVVRAAELSLRLAAAAPSGSVKPAAVTGGTTRLHGDVAAAKKGPSGPARKRRLSDDSSAAALGTPPPSDPGSDAEDSDASSVTSRATKRAPDIKHAPADDADPGVAAAGGAGDNENDREGEAQDRTARALKRPRPLSSVGRAGSAKRLQAELKPEPLADDVDAVANAGDAGAADDFEWQYDPIGNAEPGQPMFHIAVPKGQAHDVDPLAQAAFAKFHVGQLVWARPWQQEYWWPAVVLPDPATGDWRKTAKPPATSVDRKPVYLVCVRIYGRARVPALQHLEPRFLQPMEIDVRAQDRLRALPQPQRREQGQLREAVERSWRKGTEEALRFYCAVRHSTCTECHACADAAHGSYMLCDHCCHHCLGGLADSFNGHAIQGIHLRCMRSPASQPWRCPFHAIATEAAPAPPGARTTVVCGSVAIQIADSEQPTQTAPPPWVRAMLQTHTSLVSSSVPLALAAPTTAAATVTASTVAPAAASAAEAAYKGLPPSFPALAEPVPRPAPSLPEPPASAPAMDDAEPARGITPAIEEMPTPEGDELGNRNPPVEEHSAPTTPSKGHPQTPPLDEVPPPTEPQLPDDDRRPHIPSLVEAEVEHGARTPPANEQQDGRCARTSHFEGLLPLQELKRGPRTPPLQELPAPHEGSRPRTPALVDLPAPRLRRTDVAPDESALLAVAPTAIHDESQATPADSPAVAEAPPARALAPTLTAVDHTVGRAPRPVLPAAAVAPPMLPATSVAVAASAVPLGLMEGTTRAAVQPVEPTLRPDAPDFAGITWKMWESALPRQLRDCIEEIRRIDVQIVTLKRHG